MLNNSRIKSKRVHALAFGLGFLVLLQANGALGRVSLQDLHNQINELQAKQDVIIQLLCDDSQVCTLDQIDLQTKQCSHTWPDCSLLEGDGCCGPACTAQNDLDCISGNCIDNDMDGFGVGMGCVIEDCDDNDPDTYPGAPEICDGKDNDCDTQIDNGCI